MKKIIILILSCQFAVAQTAENTFAGVPQDTILHTRKWYRADAFRAVLTPSLLIGYGIITEGHHEMPFSSSDVQHWRQRNLPAFKTDIDNYLPSTPLIIMYGLDAGGVKGTNGWLNQTAIFGLSNALNGFVTKKVKHLTTVKRPDASDKLSFPSAHTSSAFVAAEILHQEFKNKSAWISVAGYSIASSVGVLRVLNNRHWMSDVIAGAGVGIFSVRLTYLVYPVIREKIFNKIMPPKNKYQKRKDAYFLSAF